MEIELSDGVENIVGKGEIARYTSNFSFAHYVFKSCLLLMRQNEYLWSKGLTKIMLPDMPILGSSNSAKNKDMI